MEEQKKLKKMGGTMRLGSYSCDVKKGSLLHKIYLKDTISERHRHRFEFNNQYLNDFEKSGMIFSGINPKNNLLKLLK